MDELKPDESYCRKCGAVRFILSADMIEVEVEPGVDVP